MNVLFIDDDLEDVEIFCEVIYDLLPDAVCAHILNCAELERELANMAPPDVIFLDGYMQPVSGKECLQRLKKVIDLARVKLFVHSGSISGPEGQDFIDQGVDGVLRKGASFEEMRATLSKALATV